MERGLTRNEIVTQLTKSPHGDLNAYVPTGKRAAKEEAEFYAHLIAWDRENGQVRDSKIALPVISLAESGFPSTFVENSLAHVAMLDPRSLVKAVRFAKSLKVEGHSRRVRRVVERYLRTREANREWWDRTAVQHRGSMKELYALSHVKPSDRANKILFGRDMPEGSIFAAVAQLKTMGPQEAAGTILNRKIPFLIALGALGAKAKETDLAMALIERMSPTELVTNAKMLERIGVKTNPVLKAAYAEGLKRVAKSTKKATLKTTKAVGALSDAGLKAQMQEVQEKQIASMKGIEGNWLVIGDKSGSMSRAIEAARHVSGTLAKLVRGNVYLVFINTAPQFFDVTGKTYEEVTAATRNVTAGGGTSIGCGLLYAIDRKLEIDGIAIVSDGGDNTSPLFHDVYSAFVQATGKQIPVYLYHLTGEADVLTRYMSSRGHDLQRFEIDGADYYSLPNMATTMRANRYSLADEIMETPLLTLDEVFNGNVKND